MMVLRGERLTEHLLRRAGFGASQGEVDYYLDLGHREAVNRLVDYEDIPDTVDAQINQPGFVGITTRGQFSPNSVITDSRQRWLFRMVHSQRPLQEKMTVFWHNHFATAYSKVSGALGASEGARYMAAKPSEDPGRVRGQIEMLRDNALGNFRSMLELVAKDVAMLVWLDGRTNIKAKPQENFGRELMELFSMGVGFYTERDVYAAARVFTGWNLTRSGAGSDPAAFQTFNYNPLQHDTASKEFSFPIYTNGSRTIPARAAGTGMLDGQDLIAAVARHPETARRLARKLYAFFISETSDPDESLVDRLATVYLQNDTNMRPVVRELLTSAQFTDPANRYTRYSWPVEYVVRAIKEVGWVGLSLNDVITPLSNMGQQLFEPPDVSGWNLGRDWFSTGSMLARMNFASQLAFSQKFNLSNDAKSFGSSPDRLLDHCLDMLTPRTYARDAQDDLLGYLNSNIPRWTNADPQVTNKMAGLVHLIVGSAEYQFV
jgi:uncharacterized protein (DUF1800 family)